MPVFQYTAVAGREMLPALKRRLPVAVALVKRPPAEISIALVGDKRMADLHRQFMDIAGPTDVLTFELDHDARGRCTAGEIVVCVPYARREGRRRGIEVADELLLYALHGVLHLSGYDDLDPTAYRRMHREEDRILESLGVGRIFSGRPDAKSPRR